MDLCIINGPNLNLLGIRQPEIYGDLTMDEILGNIREKFPNHNITFFQSNHEGALIDKLQEIGFSFDGIVLNGGALTHTSIALADAVKSIQTPVVEIHISDINKREEFRKHSYLTEVTCHHIIGKGTVGYEMAIKYLIDKNQ